MARGKQKARSTGRRAARQLRPDGTGTKTIDLTHLADDDVAELGDLLSKSIRLAGRPTRPIARRPLERDLQNIRRRDG